ncbi:blue copper protein-like [Rosa sericea]
MAISTPLVVIAFFVVFPSMVLAKQYVVGDDEGWDGNVDYQAWADDKTFKLGDVLIFKYDAGSHNVAQAFNADGYDSCTSSPELGVYTSGNDALTFNLVGSYYFLCDYHCDSDQQKVMINIVT